MSISEPVFISPPPKPSFELPKDISENLGGKTVREEVVLISDYTIIEKDASSSRVSLKNLRIENKRRLNV